MIRPTRNDEPFGKDEAPIEEPRMISRWAFWVFVFATTTSLMIVEGVATSSVGWATGFRVETGWLGGLMYPNLWLAGFVVNHIFKRFGLSWSGTTRGIQKRTDAQIQAEGTVADDEIVEVGMPESLTWVMILGSLACCAGMTARLLLARPHGTGVLPYCVIIALFGSVTVLFIYEVVRRKPQSRADSSGIWGLSRRYHPKPRFVPWSDVATCEIATYHDISGKPILIQPTLMGIDGRPLLTLNLLYTRVEDQERLVRFIRAKLPKKQPDPLDW